MGADFICTYLPIPKDKDGAPMRLNFEAAIQAIAATDWLQTAFHWDRSGDQDIGETRAALRAAVEWLQEMDMQPRDIIWLERPTEWLVLTGGLSWGDDPTDSFDFIELLVASGLDKVLTRAKGENS